MRFTCFTIGRAYERDTDTAFAEVREHAAVKDLIVGMGQNDQERGTAAANHDGYLRKT